MSLEVLSIEHREIFKGIFGRYEYSTVIGLGLHFRVLVLDLDLDLDQSSVGSVVGRSSSLRASQNIARYTPRAARAADAHAFSFFQPTFHAAVCLLHSFNISSWL
jgi:hypothetical protein